MRRFLRTVSIALICGLLCSPVLEARGRNDHNNGGGQRPSTQQNSPQRPGNSGRPQRPGNNGQPQRPGNNNHNQPQRPGSNHNQPQRPGNNHQPQRPDYGHHNPPRPPHNVHYGVPNRPMLPPPRPWVRPVPPPRYTPFRGPSLSTILGVALGSTINYALNQLVYNGYNVTGYGDNAIYLTNVNQLNMIWPNATMHYVNGMLTASDFVYSTPYYDLNRYNVVLNMLNGAYGVPVSTSPYGNGGMVTSWWGANGQYITLSYAPMMASNGSLRYYTTLSFGN